MTADEHITIALSLWEQGYRFEAALELEKAQAVEPDTGRRIMLVEVAADILLKLAGRRTSSVH